jgi:O-antigen ligase
MSGTTFIGPTARSAAPVVLVAAIAWPAIAFCGVYPWAYTTLMVLCAVFASCALVGCGWRVDAVLAACAVSVAAAVLLQLVPLSPATLQTVSPAGARFLAQQDLGYTLGSISGPVWHPLSLNPAATWRFLGFFASLAAVFAGVTSLGTAMSLRFVPVTVTAVGSMLALAAIIQAGAGSNLMYGVWAPETHAAVFGPFVNRNHFATSMLLAIPVAMAQCAAQLEALAHEAGPRSTIVELLGAPRAGPVLLTAFACVLMSVALLTTGSRSGFGGFVVIATGVVWLYVRRRKSIRAAAPAAALVLALAVVAVGWIGWRPIAARINELPGTRLSGRLDAWSEAGRIARDFWLTGSGLNTYATTMLTYHEPNVRDFFRTPHNDYLQALCDGGALVGLPLLATIGVLAVRIARGATNPANSRSLDQWTRYGAAVGLTAVACQELVDFGLQTPANAVLFVVLAAYAAGPRPAGRSKRGADGTASEAATH